MPATSAVCHSNSGLFVLLHYVYDVSRYKLTKHISKLLTKGLPPKVCYTRSIQIHKTNINHTIHVWWALSLQLKGRTATRFQLSFSAAFLYSTEKCLFAEICYLRGRRITSAAEGAALEKQNQKEDEIQWDGERG